MKRIVVVAVSILSVVGVSYLTYGLGRAAYHLFIDDDISYDEDDPDYRWIAEALSEDDEIDFARLSNDSWRKACVFGSYSNPQDLMPAEGGTVTKEQKRRLDQRVIGWRMDTVEEFEGMVAYVLDDGATHFVHVPYFQYQNVSPHCVERPNTRLRLRRDPELQR